MSDKTGPTKTGPTKAITADRAGKGRAKDVPATQGEDDG